jgi:hypothetical protein
MRTYRSDPSGSPPFPPYRWLNEAMTLRTYKRALNEGGAETGAHTAPICQLITLRPPAPSIPF